MWILAFVLECFMRFINKKKEKYDVNNIQSIEK